MTELSAGQTLEELTKLVRESMNALGFGEVLFAIRPVPFEFRNWDIDVQLPATLRVEERSVLTTMSRELRDRHYLLLSDVPSPYAA